MTTRSLWKVSAGRVWLRGIGASVSLQIGLDVLDVFAGLRPAARILCREAQAERLAGTVVQAGGDIVVSEGVVFQSRMEDGWTDRLGSSGIPFLILYVARDLRTARRVREADAQRLDGELGRLLGYPDCCVQHVERNSVPSVADCIQWFSRGDEFDPLLWPPAMAVDLGLTPHFPCSRACRESRAMAVSRLRTLKAVDDELSSRMRRALHLNYCQSRSGRIGTFVGMRGQKCHHDHAGDTLVGVFHPRLNPSEFTCTA